MEQKKKKKKITKMTATTTKEKKKRTMKKKEEEVAEPAEREQGGGREGGVEENSTRRSSAAITGCQLAKKSNARLPSLCDAMLMACRCLFSTRCLHTWLDPRGISEMFLAPIRNHILLLSSLSVSVSVARLLSPSRRSSARSRVFLLRLPPSRRPPVLAAVRCSLATCRVSRSPGSSLTPTTTRSAFSALSSAVSKFVSVPFRFFARREHVELHPCRSGRGN